MTALVVESATALTNQQDASASIATVSTLRDDVSVVQTNEKSDWDAIALERMATTGPGKQLFEFPEDGLRFTSRFDGGNMRSAERVATDTYHIELAEDASECGISTGYTTWFQFEVQVLQTSQSMDRKDALAPRELHIVLTNMNGQKGLYSHGYTVVYCGVDSSALGPEKNDDRVFDNEKQWRRIPTPLRFEKYMHTAPVPLNENAQVNEPGMTAQTEEDAVRSTEAGPQQKRIQRTKQETKMKMSFSYRIQFPHERVRFAFCYPYSFSRLQRKLHALDLKYQNPPSVQHDPTAILTLSKSAPANTSAIYYHRELLTRSIEGLRVDLLTISSFDGILSTRDPAIDALQLTQQCQAPVETQQRAFRFDVTRKKTVFISARVHPGETPANFMLHGMLALLLHPTDEGAISLRRHFVFKIIPMLNPDGVCQGYYRTDTRGVNLNRVYEAPSPEHAPTVFAAKELLLELVKAYGGARCDRASDNVVYLDLHAHANRRGCFVYGNHVATVETGIAKQIETQLFARLVALNTPFFDYLACSFDKENMSRHDLRDNNNATTSREGSGRVALYKATGLTYVYTIECNYNEGRRNLRLSSSSATPSPVASPASKSSSGLRRTSSQPSLSSGGSGLASTLLARHSGPSGGTRLYTKYSPAEWIDVGIGSLVSLLDLFQLPGRSKNVQASPFRSLDGIRKSLWSELKATQLLQSSNSGATSTQSSSSGSSSTGSSRDVVKSKASSRSSAPIATPSKRPSAKM
ncbi:Metalloprotease family m14a, partial [Globisporangium splendens]